MKRRTFLKLNALMTGGFVFLPDKLNAAGYLSTNRAVTASELLSSPATVTVIDGQEQTVKLENVSRNDWATADFTVTLSGSGSGLGAYLSAPKRSVKKVVVAWKYSQSRPQKYLGDHFERSYGDLQWQGVPLRMPWYFLAFDGQQTTGYGVRTGCSSIVTWTITSEGSLELTLDVRSGVRSVQLGSRRLHMADVVVFASSAGMTPFRAQREFCKLMCAKPLRHPVPIYGANDWYYSYGNNSQEKLIWGSGVASDLAAGLFNRPFSVVDAGWQKFGGCQGGPWNVCNIRFKSMSSLAAKMKETGCKPGIWYRPLRTEEQHPATWLRKPKMLDPSVPEVLEKIKTEIRTFKEWGYQLIKHDFTTFDVCDLWGFEMRSDWYKDASSVFADGTKTTAEIILNLYRAIREAAGDTVILGCNTLSHLAAGLVEIQRIGDDTSGQQWERTRKMGVNTLAFRLAQHETFYQADADCVGLTTKVPWKLNQQWLRLVAESGTPLFVSSQPEALGAEQKAAIRAAYATASNSIPEDQYGEPLDWLETPVPQQWKLLGRRVSFDWYG